MENMLGKGAFLGHNISLAMIKFGDRGSFGEINTYGEVQRKLSVSRKNQIAAYVLSAIALPDKHSAFFAPIVVSERDDNVFALLDGQHRYRGMEAALATLEERILILTNAIKGVRNRDIPWLKIKRNDIDRRFKDIQKDLTLQKQYRDALRETVLPIMVYHGLTLKEEQQLFYDLNNLSKKVVANLSVQYNHADPYSEITKTIVDHTELAPITSLAASGRALNGTVFTFSTIHRAFKTLIGRTKVTEANLQDVSEDCLEFAKIICSILPSDSADSKYLFNDSRMLVGTAKWAHGLRKQYDDWKDRVYTVLAQFDWSRSNLQFHEYGDALLRNDGTVVFTGSAAGETAIQETLIAVEDLIRRGLPTVEEQDALKDRIRRILGEQNGKMQISDLALAKKVSARRDEVRNALREMIDDGEIVETVKPGKSNVYTLISRLQLV